MASRIIGVCGFIGSGKNTVAEILQEDHGYVNVSFAGVLKDMCSSLFGWDRDLLEGKTEDSREFREHVDTWWESRLGIKGFTPRLAMQLMGTEVMRDSFHPDIWVIAAERIIQSHDKVVISDVRFHNEIDMIRRNFGQVWRVVRGPDPIWFHTAQFNEERMGELYPEIHPSEYIWVSAVPGFDYTLDNNKTPADLRMEVIHALEAF